MSCRMMGSGVTGVTSLMARDSLCLPPPPPPEDPPEAELAALLLLEVDAMEMEEVEDVPCSERARFIFTSEPTGEQPGLPLIVVTWSSSTHSVLRIGSTPGQ
jgi:hypothetical protein